MARVRLVVGAFSLVFVAACGNKTTTTTDAHVSLSGVISAPNGTIAAVKPGLLERMWAALYPRPANAALDGTSAVSGAAVALIRVDADGNQVGAALAEGTSGSDGTYSLTLPDGFGGGSDYVVRAAQNNVNLDAFVTQVEEQVDIDPVSHAARELLTSQLTTAGKALSGLQAGAVEELAAEVMQVARATDFSAATTTAGFLAAAKAAANADEETSNQLASVAASDGFCGTVTSANAAALPNIVIFVLKHDNWVLQARTRTDKTGAYCVNTPAGDYILGAMNYSGVAYAASEWWTTGGGTTTPFDAEKITLQASGTPVNKDFQLAAGVRLAGSVMTQAGSALGGVLMIVRDWDTNIPVARMRTKRDGGYRVNLAPGNYRLEAMNRTQQRYASEYYNSIGDGALGSGYAEKITLSQTGTTIAANFDLGSGRPIVGTVLDAPVGTAVPGMRIDVRDTLTGGSIAVLRTNKDGLFRIQLRPGNYSLYARGQSITRDTRNGDALPVVFNTNVGRQLITVTDGSGNPVSQAKLALRETNATLVSVTPTDTLGQATIYGESGKSYHLSARIDDGRALGSEIYDNVTTDISNATLLNGFTAGTANAAATVGLGVGAVLEGTVTVAGGTPVPDAAIQVIAGTCPTDCGNGAKRYVFTRTRADGTYKVSLPENMIAGVRVRQGSSSLSWTASTASVTMSAAQANTLNVEVPVIGPLGVYAAKASGSTDTVNVYWKPAPGAVSYKIYRGATSGFTVDTANPTASTSSTSYTDTGLSAGTYYYRVTSVDASGNESAANASDEINTTLAL